MSSTSGDPHFDRWTQNFTLIGSDGQPFTTDMGEINFERQWGIRVAINWASQIGASVMLIVVLMLLTKREKRKSSIFIVNAACLVLNTIRSILQCVWLTTEFFNPYAIVSNDYSRVKNLDYGNTILSNVVLLLLTACIMISLSLQVWVVCVTLSPTHRLVTMVVTSLVALVAVGYRFAITVFSNIQTMQERTLTQYESTLMAAHITQAIAVWLYCVVFTVKLGQALYQRRKMNMRQFGPMQVVFIMGCQTMIIPAISTSLQLYETVPELSSQSSTIICVFLPLSAIWAAVVANNPNVSSRGADGPGHLIWKEFGRTPSPMTEKKSSFAYSTYSGNGKEPLSPSPRHAKTPSETAIYMDREWSVEEGEPSSPRSRAQV